MINHHPEQNQLSQFVQGSLSPAESFIVSAHCDLCPRCRKIASEETSRFAAEVFDFSSLSQDEQLESYSAMLADITQLPATAKPATKAASVSSITAKRGRGEKTIELAEQASRRGWITYKRVGDVIEVLFPNLINKQEQEWLREQG